MQTEPTPSKPDNLAGALQQLLGLPPAERQQMLEVLRLAGGAATAADPVTDISPEDARTAVTDWLKSIEDLVAWERLQLLEAALADVESEAETGALSDARKALLDAHPPLAVRRAVVELVTLHPVATGVGALGLLLALLALGRNVFRAMF